MIRVATAPISWGVCEIPDWGEARPYPRVLDEMRACGYDGTELGPWGFLPTDVPTLRRELASRSLALAGAFCPVDLRAPDVAQTEPTIALLAALGGVLVLADSSPRHALRDDQWSGACAGIDRIAARAAAAGVTAAFHPHADTAVEQPAEIERLLAGSRVGLCLDTGHVGYGGGDPVALARRYAERVTHVHLKDLRREVRATATDLRDAVARGVFAPLGAGDLDIRGVLAALGEARYDGWLVVEQDTRLGVTPDADPVRDALAARAYLREAVSA